MPRSLEAALVPRAGACCNADDGPAAALVVARAAGLGAQGLMRAALAVLSTPAGFLLFF